MIEKALGRAEVRAALSGPVRDLPREEIEVLDYKPPVGWRREIFPFRREESPPRKRCVVGVDRLR